MSLQPLLVALAGPGQPEAGLAALDQALAATIGHRLFTVLVLDEARGVNRRYYSSQPVAYPVSGEKKLMRDSELYRLVVQQGVPRFCDGREAMARAFFDHELIFSLGCEACVNMPVRWNGRTLGALNLLHEAGHFAAIDMDLLATFAALAVAPILEVCP